MHEEHTVVKILRVEETNRECICGAKTGHRLATEFLLVLPTMFSSLRIAVVGHCESTLSHPCAFESSRMNERLRPCFTCQWPRM